MVVQLVGFDFLSPAVKIFSSDLAQLKSLTRDQEGSLALLPMSNDNGVLIAFGSPSPLVLKTITDGSQRLPWIGYLSFTVCDNK